MMGRLRWRGAASGARQAAERRPGSHEGEKMRLHCSLRVVVGMPVIVVLAARCGSSPATPPTTPTPIPTVAPTPVPTPAGIVLPAGLVCDPTPPPLKRVLPQMWRPRGKGWILDTKPQVM